MPPSQLKRLKASLHEQGITGQQKSKKQKKNSKKDATTRIQRNVALQQIRESFNPFEYKAANARPEKFASVSHKSISANGGTGKYRDVLHRPGVSKGAGEEMRRATLLPEMRRRNKVGGLVDRRIGEGDTDMTPEERAVQRFAREKERKSKGGSLFDLEASDDERIGLGSKLTHGGRSLDDLETDDMGGNSSDVSDAAGDDQLFRLKRRRPDQEEDADLIEPADEEEPERKRTKKEVMEEVIAKSKLYKYERQKAKEDDEDLREELDKGVGEMLALLRGSKPPPPQPSMPIAVAVGPAMNPDRQKMLNGEGRTQLDKEYEVRLKQLAQDTRAKPSERTKTAEEKAAAEANRLRELEEKRTRRMQGAEVSEDEAERNEHADFGDGEDVPDQAAEFGFSSAVPTGSRAEQLVLLDEDEFALDEDLVASGSDAGLSDMDSITGSGSDDDIEDDANRGQQFQDDEEDEFVRGILGSDVISSAAKRGGLAVSKVPNESTLAFTYPCPRSHSQLVEILQDNPLDQLATIVQRIRALYHPSLSASNKESMADFSSVLVDHLSHMGNEKQPLAIAEQVIRHLHSLSRAYPVQIAQAFRKHLAAFHTRGQPLPGDFIILTAIGSIYPTSDHWHQVVTPAVTVMARWLGLNAPVSGKPLQACASETGAFLTALCLKYQTLSKRYIPEALRFTLRVLSVESVVPDAHLANLLDMVDLWKHKSAFVEMFSPAIPLLKSLSAKKEVQHLRIHLAQSRLSRRPLQLHNHRQLPIRTSIPKFEDNYNPDKHYDPDKERSDSKKLQKEYKRERKGALRELRKDANFIAREQLREKRTADEEYEKKYRRLVASVQAEEGHEAKEYAREKARRGKKR